MTVEQQIADMQQASVEQTQASQVLADEVAGKMGEIDSKLTEKQQSLDVQYQGFTEQIEAWKAEIPYFKEYRVSAVENSDSDGSGNYNLVKLYTVTEAYQFTNAWIHLGWMGSGNVGSGSFCSMLQTHSAYTGQTAMFSKRGSGDVRFFVDLTLEGDANVYVALKNMNKNSAAISLSAASCSHLTVDALGAVDLDVWLASNSKITEIELINIAA